MAEQSTDDMVNSLLTQQAMGGPQPSVLGMTAAPGQSQIAAALSALQKKQFQDSYNNAPQGDWLSNFANGGKQNFGQVGKQLGGMINSALAPAPQAPQAPPFTVSPPAQGQALDGTTAAGQTPNITPNPGANPQQTATNGLLATKALYTSLIKQGVPADQASVQALSKAVEWGVPNADTRLATAQDDLLKNRKLQAESSKDQSQGDADRDMMRARLVDEANRSRERDQADSRLGIEQQNADTERMKANKMPSAADVTPDAIQRMVDEKLDSGKDPTGLTKSGLLIPYQNALAARLRANGDTQGAANAQAQGYKAAGQQLGLATKQSAMTQIAGAQIEKNINSLQPIVDKMGGFGSPVLQKAINQWNQGAVGDKDTAEAVFYINELQSELGRIASGSFGNTPLSDSAKADAKDLINKSMIGTGSLEGAFAAARQSYKNKLQSVEETKQQALATLGQNAKGSPFGPQGGPAPIPGGPPVGAAAPQAPPAPPQASTTQQQPVLTYDPKTGTFH